MRGSTGRNHDFRSRGMPPAWSTTRLICARTHACSSYWTQLLISLLHGHHRRQSKRRSQGEFKEVFAAYVAGHLLWGPVIAHTRAQFRFECVLTERA